MPLNLGWGRERAAPAVRPWIGWVVPVVVLVVLLALPFVTLDLPGVLPDRVNGPGSMQLPALCLVFGGIALSYDVLFGRTGLLSFGHALFVAAGSYGTALSLAHLDVGLGVAVLLTLGAGLVLRNPSGLTGGEEGLPLVRDAVPDLITGVVNAPYRYWLALAYRENEERVAVLGVSTYRAKLLAVVVGGFLGTLGGIAHLLVVGGAGPTITTADFTLGLLVMVVLGGAGSRWGAVIGGVLYTYLDSRLLQLASSDTVQSLPAVVRVPASEPLFVLGGLFILVVFFAPGGLVGLAKGRAVGPRTLARRRRRAA